MTSFAGIARLQDMSPAIIRAGIAEALAAMTCGLATAMCPRAAPLIGAEPSA